MSYALTAGELRVARVLVTGASNKAIAETTGLTLATVKLHVHEILQKLQVQNRTQAALRLLAPVFGQLPHSAKGGVDFVRPCGQVVGNGASPLPVR